MVYFFLRSLVKLTLRMYFKNIEITGHHHIPKDKPVIFVGNHPSAFMEPILLACWTWRPLYFMIRGDMWKKKALAWLLDAIHGVPVYRKSEGYSSVDANKKTFDRCVELIMDHKLLIIFAEGSHQLVRRLRSLKKGTARIVHQALTENPDEDVYLVPVGAIFNAPLLLRRDVHISIGKAVPLRQHLSTTSNAESYNQITAVIEQSLSAELPSLTSEEELIYEQLIYEEAQFGKPFSQQWRDAEARLHSLTPDDKARLITDTKSVDTDLENQVLSKQLHLGHWLILILLAIPAWVGKLLHMIPIALSQRVTNSIVRKKEFYSSLRVATLLVFVISWYLITIGISALVFGSLWPVYGMLLTGLISLPYFDLWRVARARK